MKDAFSEFRCTVAPRYEWQDWLDEKGRPIVPRKTGLRSTESASAVKLLWERSQKTDRILGPVLSPVEGGTNAGPYPMRREHAALFREFAALDYRNLDSILEFAHRFGGLGTGLKHQRVMHRGADGELHDHLVCGEPYLDWAYEICRMRDGLQLAAERSRDKSLQLQELLNRHLQRLQGRFEFTPSGEPKLLIEPLTLISAMWLQLALALTGDKEFRTCKFCGRIFEISTENTGYRRHREFCRESCKTLDYRKRRRTAIRLLEVGADAEKVAFDTKTPVATVRAWAAAARPSGRTGRRRRT